MRAPLPRIDERTPELVAEQTRALLRHYLAAYGWNNRSDGGEAGRALAGIFAHYCGLIIDRINRAPDKNLLAFLELLGNSLNPPIPAEAPLTFFLDAAAPGGLAIRAGTRVQVDPSAPGGSPVLFETVADLWLSNFELKYLGTQDPDNDETVSDISSTVMGQPVETAIVRIKKQRLAADELVFDAGKALLVGLYLSPERSLEAGRPVSLYLFIDAPVYDPTLKPPPAEQPPVIWEYLTGITGENLDWTTLAVADGSAGLTQSGTVEFLVPADMFRRQGPVGEFACYWVRTRLATGNYSPAPRFNGAALNTVLARQTVTVRGEVLGSSSGNPSQVFRSRQSPILEGERLEVLERPMAGATAEAEVWTLWQAVSGFHASGSLDRHYVVDRVTGEIRFGDGQRGLIPPPGTRNLRLAEYRSGGGVAGNVPAGAIKTLVSAGRYIERVTNFLPAAGGADAETEASLLERAPKVLRHRGRAVTAEDYEDLARLASPQVARALCVPLLNLAEEPAKPVPASADEKAAGAGWLSVIVVPHGGEPAPLPSRVLLSQVAGFLRRHGSPSASISVTGPLYLRIGVTLQVELEAPRFQDSVTRALDSLLRGYLHPLTGRGGPGWTFGRAPHESDIHALIADAGIRGIAVLRGVGIEQVVDARPLGCRDLVGTLDCVLASGRFLICSGNHRILAS